MLVAMGIPVFRNMQFLELPNISLEVARECSGINYLLSIVAVGAPLAYFTQRTALRKASLIVFAVIVGVVANAVRITLIGVWAYMGGAVVHGPMHILQGFSVSVAGFAFLFAGAWALGGRGPRIEEADAKGGMDEGLSVKPEAMGRLNIAVAVAISLLLATSGFIYLHKVNDVPLKKDIKDIPLHIRQWSGAPYISGFSLAGATSEHSILYSDQNGAQTMFYIGYFSSQTQGREMVDFRLANIYSRSERFYIKAPAGAEYSVSKAIVNEGGRRFLLMYWYDLGGRVVADRFAQKFYTAIGGIFLRRTNGAMLMLSREITADASVEEVLRDEAMLAGDMIEALRGMVPQ
jgi:EpsI family protein